MKLVKYIFLILAMGSYVFAYANECILLKKNQIGPIKSGVHIFELAAFDKKAVAERVFSEGEMYLSYTFDLEEVGPIKVYLDSDDITVTRVETESKKLTTGNGAHIGNTLNELKLFYPDAYLTPAWDMGENLYSFVLPNGEGVFLFSADSIQETCGENNLDCEEFMGEVKSIRFFTL